MSDLIDEETESLVRSNTRDRSLEDENAPNWVKGVSSSMGIRFQYALMAAAVVIVLVLSFTADSVELQEEGIDADLMIGKNNTIGISDGDQVLDLTKADAGFGVDGVETPGTDNQQSDEVKEEESGYLRKPDAPEHDGQTDEKEVLGGSESSERGIPSQQTPTETLSSTTDSSSIDTSDESSQQVEVSPVQGDKGFLKRPNAISDVYLKRGKATTSSELDALSKKWGSWTFSDPKATARPKNDFYAEYPSRDVPSEKFPESAWQRDAEYLKDFLPQAQSLVDRAMEAIMTEYGRGKFDMPEDDFESRAAMFPMEFVDVPEVGRGTISNWVTSRSFDGLVRRLLHAIMTEDTFTFVMSGHSASAGHGNLFQQSYTMQVQKVLEPIMARFGVKMTARNAGLGGLGTLQTGLGAGPILGKNADIVMWDSGMTEREAYAPDMLWSQSILAGDRAPMLLNGGSLDAFHNGVDADVAKIYIDPDLALIPKTTNATQVETLPWASRYHHCSRQMHDICETNKYHGECWVERDDFTPAEPQDPTPGGRAGWHPGDRTHQLKGRAIAFFILRALKKGLADWASVDNFSLPDSAWHMHDYIQNIKQKLSGSETPVGHCGEIAPSLVRACNLPMQARTDFSPKAKPWETSIRTIFKGDYGYEILPNEYDPPDVFVPSLNVPDGTFEYLAVVENGVDFVDNSISRKTVAAEERKWMNNSTVVTANQHTTFLPGQGFYPDFVGAPNGCDGTYDSFCLRDPKCLLYGANDNRGGWLFDGLAGWMVLNLENMQNGLAILKIEDWHPTNGDPATEGWMCENGETTCESGAHRRLSEDESDIIVDAQRNLKYHPPPYCDDFFFDFAIDGKVTSWDKKEFQEKLIKPQRVVQTATLLDDPNYRKGDVELAFRIRGCGRKQSMKLTHVYWS